MGFLLNRAMLQVLEGPDIVTEIVVNSNAASYILQMSMIHTPFDEDPVGF